ncbi:MAG: hypothetical protein ACRDAM_06650, partial [Casimicrobium sp.]
MKKNTRNLRAIALALFVAASTACAQTTTNAPATAPASSGAAKISADLKIIDRVEGKGETAAKG